MKLKNISIVGILAVIGAGVVAIFQELESQKQQTEIETLQEEVKQLKSREQ